MADIGVVTFHRASNYGAVLQTWALQRATRKLGFTSEVVDYRSPFLEAHYEPKGVKTLLSPRDTGVALLRNGYMRDRRSIFAEFVQQEIEVSEVVYSPQNIMEANDKYENFIAGSDQVWNPYTAGFDKTYFLDFVSEGRRKNAYAASIGLESLTADQAAEFSGLLRDFRSITVREGMGADLLEKIIGQRPEVVLDPTLLLTPDEWRSLGDKGNAAPEGYTLVYLLAEDPALLRYARHLARNRGTRLIYITQRLFRPKGMACISKATPYDFVALFGGADSVVTNSFHGMAFSANLSTDLHFNYLPEPARVNSRLKQLEQRYRLQERRVSSTESLPRTKATEFERISEQLGRDRAESLAVLRNMASQ